MSHFQVTATLDSGATVLSGVEAADETAAAALAYERLSWSGKVIEQLQVTPLTGSGIGRLCARSQAGE